MSDSQNNFNQVKSLLAVYAYDNNIPDAAIPLMEQLIKANVSYDQADAFCADHFINSSVAQYYQEFYKYVVTTKEQKEEKPNVISSDMLKQISALLRETADKIEQMLG